MTSSSPQTPKIPLEPKSFSLLRARILVFIVALLVAACIAVANVSSEPLTADDVGKALQGATIERAYGWPSTWYWRSPVIPVPFPATNPRPIQWSVSRYSAAHLAADAAVWLAILLPVWACGGWLMRRYPPWLRWRPRAATLFALLLATAIMVLANLSSDIGPGQLEPHSCGWPLIWYWQSYVDIWWQRFTEWHFSAAKLAGSFVIWATLLAVVAVVTERLARRYQPRLRWSLRTMLAGVALVAVVCACFVNARTRTKAEAELIALIQPDHGIVYLKAYGPAWLDVVGAGRLRRRVVGVYIRDVTRQVNETVLFKAIARFPHLRYLEVQPVLIPEVELLLGEMRQLRTLDIGCRMYKREDQLATLNAVGKLTELNGLSVRVGVAGTGDLDPLATLTNLKSLALDIRNEIEPRGGLAVLRKLSGLEHLSLTAWQLSDVDLRGLAGLTNLKSLSIQYTNGLLPALPRLEQLKLTHVPVSDADIARLAACPRLSSLCLSQTCIATAGLAGLASLQSLTELAIDENTLTAEGIESLAAMKNLNSLHITQVTDEEYREDDGYASIVLDDGESLDVSSSGLDRLRRAIDSLRRAHPGIVIDTDFSGFEEREFQHAFELAPPDRSEAAL